MGIDWYSIIGSSLLIVLSIVAFVDWLQNGVAWPLLLAAIGLQVVTLLVSRK